MFYLLFSECVSFVNASFLNELVREDLPEPSTPKISSFLYDMNFIELFIYVVLFLLITYIFFIHK